MPGARGCEEGERLRSEYKRLSNDWVEAEGEMRNGSGLFGARSKRLDAVKEEYRRAYSGWCDHLVFCDQCREAAGGLCLRA